MLKTINALYYRCIKSLLRLISIRKHCVLKLNLTSELTPVTAQIPVECLPVTLDDIVSISEFASDGTIAELRKLASTPKYSVVYAFKDRKALGYLCSAVCISGLWRVNGYWQISAGEAFLFKGRVDNVFRGHRIFGAMATKLCELLFTNGVSTVYVESEVHNMPSIQGLTNVGFQLIGVRRYIVFANRIIFDLGWSQKFHERASERPSLIRRERAIKPRGDIHAG
jgi:hypothetical protein